MTDSRITTTNWLEYELVETAPRSIRIRIFAAERRDESLSEAVSKLIETATAMKCGVLVTRHRYDLYSAEVSRDVGPGLIHETSHI